MLDAYRKFSFLYTDLSNFTGGHIQHPHVDMYLDNYKNKKVKLAVMPLTSRGMFLEAWPPDKGEGQLVFIKYVTVFINKSVHHANCFSPGESEASRIQFCFSEKF